MDLQGCCFCLYTTDQNQGEIKIKLIKDKMSPCTRNIITLSCWVMFGSPLMGEFGSPLLGRSKDLRREMLEGRAGSSRWRDSDGKPRMGA